MEQKDSKITTNPEGKSTTIAIEAPEYLEYGQNLLDQEPFKGIVVEIQEKTGLDDKFIPILKQGVIETIQSSIPLKGLAGEKRRQIRYSIIQHLSKISETFPFITEYFDAVLGDTYLHNGNLRKTINEDSYSKFPTKSYAKWLFDKQQREGRITSLEVKSLVFNEPATSPIKTIETSGHRRGWKKWAILKAAEVTR